MRRLVVRPRALEDQRDLLIRSRREFGSAAQRAYEALIRRAMRSLCAEPTRAGVVTDDALPAGVCLFHIRHARQRRTAPARPRHFIVFTHDAATLTVIRILHDAMDVPARLNDDDT